MIKKLPSVSVVIPCHNVDSHVGQAIQSALDQSISVADVVCVDDGSTDETLSVLKGYQAKFPRQIKILTGRHLGAAVSRNRGLGRSTGEFVQFLDSDDRMMPTKLEHQLKMVEARMPNADFVAGSFLNVPLVGLAQYRVPRFIDPWANLVGSSLGVTSANLWRRQSVLSVGGWNERQRSSQEYELMFRLLQQDSLVLIDHTPLAEKIDRERSITSKIGRPNPRRKKAILNFITLRRSIRDYLAANGLLTDSLRHVYYQAVHASLKGLYPYDPNYTLELHCEILPENYRLHTSDGPGALAIDDLQVSDIRFPMRDTEDPAESVTA